MQTDVITYSELKEVYRIWSSTLGPKWPISEKILLESLRLLDTEKNCVNLGIRHDGKFIGFAIAEILNDQEAALIMLAVDPPRHRTGVGSTLLKDLVKKLDGSGVTRMSLGAGASKLLWHGVPVSLPEALHFFEKQGFIFDETSYDLVQDISSFTIPKTTELSLQKNGCNVGMLSVKTADALLAMQSKCFPDWYVYYARAIEQRNYPNVLVAVRGKEILGSVLLSMAPQCPGGHWRELLKNPLGAFGILGVIPEERDKGIGIALAAYATLELRNRGITTCFVHWTWLREWYGKIGYQVWQEYRMGKLNWA